MVILVDMDSILGDFLGEVFNMYRAETGDYSFTPEQVVSWETQMPNGSMYQYFGRPGFFRNLKPIPGAIEGLKALCEAGHEVLIVSTATISHAPLEKFEWLSEHAPWFPREKVIFTGSKQYIRGDILIDDHSGNAIKFRKENAFAKLMTLKYAYNDDPVYDGARFDHWDEIVEAIERYDLDCNPDDLYGNDHV